MTTRITRAQQKLWIRNFIRSQREIVSELKNEYDIYGYSRDSEYLFDKIRQTEERRSFHREPDIIFSYTLQIRALEDLDGREDRFGSLIDSTLPE